MNHHFHPFQNENFKNILQQIKGNKMVCKNDKY